MLRLSKKLNNRQNNLKSLLNKKTYKNRNYKNKNHKNKNHKNKTHKNQTHKNLKKTYLQLILIQKNSKLQKNRENSLMMMWK